MGSRRSEPVPPANKLNEWLPSASRLSPVSWKHWAWCMTYFCGSRIYKDTQPPLNKSSLTVCHTEGLAAHRDDLHAHSATRTKLPRVSSELHGDPHTQTCICSKALLCKYFLSHSHFLNCIGNKLPATKI